MNSPSYSAIFVFYSRSADKYPGKGTGESLVVPPETYLALSKIKDWRKMLSNFWIAPFWLEEKQWASVEHYYQASKFKHETPEFYALFSLDNNSELSINPVLAKAAGGKTGKYQGKQFRPTHIKVDNDFFTTERHRTEMNSAQTAKFSNPELAAVLSLTKGAELIHTLGRGNGTVRFDFLMGMRDGH